MPANRECTRVTRFPLSFESPVSGQITHSEGERLFLQLTGRCTLDCRFCPRALDRQHLGAWDLALDTRPDAAAILDAIGDPRAYREVVFSGLGEPTLRLQVLAEVAGEVKRRGGRVHLQTDGLANLVHDRDVLPTLAGRVDRITVALNAQDEALYDDLCRPNLPGSYAAMQRFLSDATGICDEVAASAIEGAPGVDLEACARLAQGLGASFEPRPLGRLP